MSSHQYTGFGTKLVHGGEAPDPTTGAIAPVLVRTKTFAQSHFGAESKWQYSRCKNPTRSILESKLEVMAGGGHATAFGSGDAATTMFLLTLKPGDQIIASPELYGGTIRLFDQLFANLGIVTTYVDVEDIAAVKAAQTDRTVAIWVESPGNPKLGVIDLAKVGEIARQLDLRLVADLTFAPPCTTNPFALGVETVIYSLSKYFSGHGDVIGGAIVTKNAALHDRLTWLQSAVGAILSPDECYRVIQELKTLDMRWERVSASAQQVAEHLAAHPHIKRVYYPGLASHPGHSTAAKQMKNGFGGVLSFDLRTDDLEQVGAFVGRLLESRLIAYAEGLAGPETIITHPASMSHKGMSQAQRDELGINDCFFRLSLGFEDPADIIRALDRGLGAIARSTKQQVPRTVNV